MTVVFPVPGSMSGGSPSRESASQVLFYDQEKATGKSFPSPRPSSLWSLVGDPGSLATPGVGETATVTGRHRRCYSLGPRTSPPSEATSGRHKRRHSSSSWTALVSGEGVGGSSTVTPPRQTARFLQSPSSPTASCSGSSNR